MENKLAIGTYFFQKEGSEYLVYQVLQIGSSELLVTSFWPCENQPTNLDLGSLDIRAACTSIALVDSSPERILGFQPLSTDQENEINTFLKIRASKEERASQFTTQYGVAQGLFDAGKFEETIALLSEIAPYNKLFFELYRLRGLAFYAVKNFANAHYDFTFYLENQKEKDPEIEVLIQKCFPKR